MEDFLTAQQVAELLQLHVLTIYRLAESGELPAFKVGRQWRFARQAIEEWVHKGQTRERPAVLVVDDEPSILRLLANVLEPAGVDLVEAADGETALQACAERDFDVVFLDIKLPGMDGVQVMRRLKEMGSKARIVVVTGHPGDPLVGEAAQLDPVTVLHKPFKPEQVLRALGPVGTGGR